MPVRIKILKILVIFQSRNRVQNKLNWNDEFVPQPCRDIIIPSGTVTVPAGYEALGKTLDVLIGAELVTEPTAVMDIEN